MEEELSDYDPADDVLVEDDRVIRIPPIPVFIRTPAPLDDEDPAFHYESTDSDSDSSVDEQWDEYEDCVEQTEENSSLFYELGGIQMTSKYGSVELLDNVPVDEELYDGCSHSLKDFSRYMLALKNSLSGGDEAFAAVLGTVLSFLPDDNLMSKCLEEAPTTYKLLQVLSVTACLRSDLRTYQFNSCKDGCKTYDHGVFFCPKCKESRHVHCTPQCYEANGDCNCTHPKIPRHLIYIMPVRDRIKALLKSDVKNLFKYGDLRKKTDQAGYVEDVLDSPVYQKLRREVPDGGIPIFIQLCWDGALMFNAGSGESMWPLCYSIMNLPPCLRNKVHIGMHVASFCKGSAASLDIFALELLDLWKDPIVVDGRRYYVMVSQIVMDGPGRSKYCKCQATTALAGCNLCDVKGKSNFTMILCQFTMCL